MIDHDIVFPSSAGLILAQYYFLLKGKCRTSNSKNSRALNESLSVKPAVTMLKKTPCPEHNLFRLHSLHLENLWNTGSLSLSLLFRFIHIFTRSLLKPFSNSIHSLQRQHCTVWLLCFSLLFWLSSYQPVHVLTGFIGSVWWGSWFDWVHSLTGFMVWLNVGVVVFWQWGRFFGAGLSLSCLWWQRTCVCFNHASCKYKGTQKKDSLLPGFVCGWKQCVWVGWICVSK